MGKLKNSSCDNAFGGGKQQIYTDDSGKEYIIRNSAADNVFGTGKEKIIEEKGKSSTIPCGGSIFCYIAIALLIIGIVTIVKGWEYSYLFLFAFMALLVLDVIISIFKEMKG